MGKCEWCEALRRLLKDEEVYNEHILQHMLKTLETLDQEYKELREKNEEGARQGERKES